MLANCIRSLSKIKIPAETELYLLIVENDPERASESLIMELSQHHPYPIHYQCETQLGIPFARNRCLSFAQEHQANYLIFIDDDEEVRDPEWLVQLFRYTQTHSSPSIVYGKVIYEMPTGSPDYLSEFFSGKKNKPTGTLLGNCATNNVLIPMQLIYDLDLKFDVNNPLMGGEDTLFFTDATAKGAKIYSCQEAVIHEHVASSRANISWLSKRKYRVGIGMASRKKKPLNSSALLLLVTLTKILSRLLQCLILALILQRKESIKAWLKACRSAGIACGLLGFSYDEYKVIHGE
jgi:GT2 family glycosyltransferase